MDVEVEVPKTATVAELKEAVKDVFNQSPIDEMISWYARVYDVHGFGFMF